MPEPRRRHRLPAAVHPEPGVVHVGRGVPLHHAVVCRVASKWPWAFEAAGPHLVPCHIAIHKPLCLFIAPNKSQLENQGARGEIEIFLKIEPLPDQSA